MTNLKIVLGAIVAAAALALAGPVAAAPNDALSGAVDISVHTHSSPDLLFPSDRLTFDFAEGDDFAYSSRTCADSAPFNEIGLDFTPHYPGIDDETGVASVRHLAEGTVTEVSQDGDRGTIEGTITSIVCKNEQETGDALVMDYTARFRRTSDNEVQLTGRWRFSPSDSTGTFQDITGGGSLRAQLTCLGHERDPSAPTCEDLGYFTDFVGLRGDTSAPVGETTPGLIGRFRAPTL
jgi:hypothetical protein